MSSYLITGTSRGIGLEMARYLAARPTSEASVIFATARSENKALKDLVSSSSGQVFFVKLDTTNEEDIKRAVTQVKIVLGGRSLDVLVNNAGANAFTEGWTENGFDLKNIIYVNVIGVQLVTQNFLPLMRNSSVKKIASISSSTATIVDAKKFMPYPNPAYKVSKAALNALIVQYALGLENEGFIVQAINPGWVKTDLGGGEYADITAEQAAIATLDAIQKATKEDNGTFRMIHVAGWEKSEGINQYDGGLRPWL